MTTRSARKWLLILSIAITIGQMAFLVVAPAVGYPLTYPKCWELLRIVSPVFLGYLGSAAHFAFRATSRARAVAHRENLGLILVGPLGGYIFIAGLAFGAFGYSNRVGVQVGAGMTVEDLATALSFAVGLLAAVTNYIVAHLFSEAKAISNS